MKLFLLKTIPPWDPSYDATHGLLIRAESEQHAREMANEDTLLDHASPPSRPRDQRGRLEDGLGVIPEEWTIHDRPWLDPERTSCDEVTAEGGARSAADRLSSRVTRETTSLR